MSDRRHLAAAANGRPAGTDTEAGLDGWTIVELVPCGHAASADGTIGRLVEIAFSSRRDGWMPDEIRALCERFQSDEPVREIAVTLGRPLHGVRTKIAELGLRRNSPRLFGEEEDAEILLRYGSEPAAAIAGDLGRSCASVYLRAHKLGLTRAIEPDWTDWEIEQLRAGYAQRIPVTALARMIGRTVPALATKASDLGIRHANARDAWAVREEEILYDGWIGGLTDSAIAGRLEEAGFARSRTAVKLHRQGLGLGKPMPDLWSEDEDDVLRTGYAAGRHVPDIARDLPGRTVGGLRWRARYLRLKHPKPDGARQGSAWEPDEHTILRQVYAGTLSFAVGLEQLPGRTRGAMYQEAYRLGLAGKVLRRRMTPDEKGRVLSTLDDDGPSLKAVAVELGRSYQSLWKIRQKLVEKPGLL